MSWLSSLKAGLLSALEDRRQNCEKTARMYLADGRTEAAAQCRAASGAVQECIEAVRNVVNASVPVEPDHVCGSGGYGLHPDDRCGACEEQERRWERERSERDAAHERALAKGSVNK